MKKSNTLPSLKFIVLFVTINCISISIIKAQDIQIGLGASYGIAPSISLEDAKSSASFYSIYGDLVINNQLIGRAQFSSFNAESFTEDLEGNVDSGLEFNGSLGYNMLFPSIDKLELPIMATIGYASVKNKSFTWPGMQLGFTLSPKYKIHRKVLANFTVRYLKGTGFEDGRALNQIDTSFGIMIYLL